MSRKYRRPKRFYLLDLGDDEGNQLELRLDVKAIDKLEERAKMNIQDWLEQVDDNLLENFTDLIWASRQPFVVGDGNVEGNKFTVQDAKDVLDTIVDNGGSILTISEIMQGVLQESGLMPTEEEIIAFNKKSNASKTEEETEANKELKNA